MLDRIIISSISLFSWMSIVVLILFKVVDIYNSSFKHNPYNICIEAAASDKYFKDDTIQQISKQKTCAKKTYIYVSVY
jgi:hypothetical protein